MAKETCNSCDAKLPAHVSFCPSCDHPTRYASDTERLDWDLKKWRAHVDRSVARGMNPTGAAVGFGNDRSVAVAAPPQPDTSIQPPAKPRIVPIPAPQSRFLRLLRTSAPVEPTVHGAPEPPAPVTEPDRRNEFAYERCATCSEVDWIVRYGRNGDETYKYWCVRCSRSFKTEVKLRQALKPFVSSGIVVGGLIAASTLILR